MIYVCPRLPLLFNFILKVLAKEIRQEKEVKEIQIRKEDANQSLYAGNVMLYLENCKIQQKNY